MLGGLQAIGIVALSLLRGKSRTVTPTFAALGHGHDLVDSILHGHQFQSRQAATSSAAPDKGSQKLTEHLRAKIMMRGGPISLAEYMQDALTSPHGGYYMKRDVFGTAGDFTTSPEISQMFGEMVGIWAVHTWMQMGQPPRLHLVELGPGRGTLMADLIRGTTRFKQFLASLEVHFVEVSPALRSLQWTALKCQPSGQQSSHEQPVEHASVNLDPGPSETGRGTAAAGEPAVMRGQSALAGCQVTWHDVLESVPGDIPSIYIAHEFFDALPVHQFVKDPRRGWLEKMVDVAEPAMDEVGLEQGQQEKQQQHDSKTAFRLVLSPTRTPACALLVPRRLGLASAGTSTQQAGPSALGGDGLSNSSAGAAPPSGHAAQGEIQALEVSAKAMAAAEALAIRVGRHGGAALIIDYGQDGPYADSLVALRNHKKQDVLQDPGSADLSAWVDFGALRQAATQSAAAVTCHGPATQSHFLHALGIATRLQQLLKHAKDSKEEQALLAGFDRITGGGPQGMGFTYKAMAITNSSLQGLVGFDAGGSPSE